MAWRLTSSEWKQSNPDSRRDALKAAVDAGKPTGLLAYADGEPAGWCSLAPWEEYRRLVRSRTLVPEAIESDWVLTCFYIRAGFRRLGIATALLRAAVQRAKEQGASALYAIPDRGSRKKPDSRGSIAMFEDAGFYIVPSGSTYFILMRHDLSGNPES